NPGSPGPAASREAREGPSSAPPPRDSKAAPAGAAQTPTPRSAAPPAGCADSRPGFVAPRDAAGLLLRSAAVLGRVPDRALAATRPLRQRSGRYAVYGAFAGGEAVYETFAGLRLVRMSASCSSTQSPASRSVMISLSRFARNARSSGDMVSAR